MKNYQRVMIFAFTVLSSASIAHAEQSDIHFQGSLQFEGTIFHHGDTVKFDGWSNTFQSGTTTATHPSGIFMVDVMGPDNKHVFDKNFTTDDSGSVVFSFPITNDLQFGKYVVNYTLVSKVGYETSQYGNMKEFFVSRQKSDIVEARGYDFKLLPESSEAKYQSFPKLGISICPSPNVFSDESFVDPETGISVDASHGLVIYYFTKPDGTQTDPKDNYQTTDNWFNSSCPTASTRYSFYANVGGNWTAHAVAEWVSNGTMYRIESKPINFEVTKPVFPINNVQKMNITNIAEISHVPSGSKSQFDVMDWSLDEKFILINYQDYHNIPNLFPVHLATINLDNGNLTQINLPLTHPNTETFYDAKISSAGNSLYFVIDGNLYRFDLKNKTSVQLTDTGDITKIQVLHNGDLVFSQRQSNPNTSINTNFDIWKAYPNGTKINDLFQAQNVMSFDLNPDGKKIAIVGGHSGPPGCYYCAYTEADVVDLDTKQAIKVPQLFNVHDGKWSPAGDLIIWHSEAGYKAPGGSLTLADPTGGFQETLFSGVDDPTSFVIAPDGNSIIYGLNYFSCCGGSQGLYRMHLAKAIPEFPFTIPVLLIGFTSLIVFYRMKVRKC